MERFIKLSVDGDKSITTSKQIEGWLYNSPYYWILECELDGVILSIKDNILCWEDGTFYYGTWQFGIWKKGQFRSGHWLGGVFYEGVFKGNWNRGVWKGGEFKGKDLSGSRFMQ